MTNSTQQAAEFLRTQHETGSRSWRGLCLKLQRTARGLPVVYPSAISAMRATPESERVYKVADLRRGMIAYSDDPNDSNPYGHIYFIAGWKDGSNRSDPNDLLTWSNDVRVPGGVDLVPITFYRTFWGDGFQFGATWLNGFSFTEFDVPPNSPLKPPAPTKGVLGKNYNSAVESVERAIAYHKAKGHSRLVKALQRDLAVMKKRQQEFK